MLQLKFAIQRADSCESFILADTSGIFNNTTNTGGYGTPNIEAVDVITSFLYVYDTDNTTIKYTIPTYDSISDPPYTVNFNTVVANTNIGITGSIPASIVKMKYRVSTVSADYEKEQYVFLSCSAYCCFDTMIAEAVNCGCSDKEKLLSALYVQGLILSIEAALSPACNKVEQAYVLLDELNKICAGEDCSGCH